MRLLSKAETKGLRCFNRPEADMSQCEYPRDKPEQACILCTRCDLPCGPKKFKTEKRPWQPYPLERTPRLESAVRTPGSLPDPPSWRLNQRPGQLPLLSEIVRGLEARNPNANVQRILELAAEYVHSHLPQPPSVDNGSSVQHQPSDRFMASLQQGNANTAFQNIPPQPPSQVSPQSSMVHRSVMSRLADGPFLPAPLPQRPPSTPTSQTVSNYQRQDSGASLQYSLFSSPFTASYVGDQPFQKTPDTSYSWHGSSVMHSSPPADPASHSRFNNQHPDRRELSLGRISSFAVTGDPSPVMGVAQFSQPTLLQDVRQTEGNPFSTSEELLPSAGMEQGMRRTGVHVPIRREMSSSRLVTQHASPEDDARRVQDSESNVSDSTHHGARDSENPN